MHQVLQKVPAAGGEAAADHPAATFWRSAAAAGGGELRRASPSPSGPMLACLPGIYPFVTISGSFSPVCAEQRMFPSTPEGRCHVQTETRCALNVHQLSSVRLLARTEPLWRGKIFAQRPTGPIRRRV